MDRAPRDPRTPLLTANLFKRIGLVSLLFVIGAFGLFEWMVQVKGATLAEAQTVTASVFVMGEMAYLFNCRSLTRSMFRIGLFTNRPALWGSVGMIVLQVLFAQTPWMNRLFHTAPIGLDAWAAVALFSLAVYVIIELEKRLVGHALQGTSFRRPAHPA